MVVEVVDTNVWVNVDKLQPQTDAERQCVLACIQWGAEFSRGTEDYKLAADYAWKIMTEYRKNIKPGGLAERYLNVLLSQPITRLVLVDVKYDSSGCAILPDNISIDDEDDRKFVAVSLAFKPPAPIINATDTDWIHAKARLTEIGIPLKELCSSYIEEKIGK